MKLKILTYNRNLLKTKREMFFSPYTILMVLVVACVCSINSFGQGKKQMHDFTFWMVGNSATPRFGKGWNEALKGLQQNKDEFNCLLNSIATEPHTLNEILAHCQMLPDWLQQAIDSLETHNYIGKTSNSTYYSKIPVMTDTEMKRVQENLKPISLSVAEKIRKDISEVIQVYNETRSDTDPSWQDISHLVIDKLLIDGYFHRGLGVLEREHGLKKYYSQDQKKIPAFFMGKGSQYGTFGVNWYALEGKGIIREVYVLHGAPLKRYDIAFNRYGRKKYFAEIFHRINTDGSLEKLTSNEIQIFSDLGWIENGRLAIPFIDANSIKVFNRDLERIGTESAELVFNKFSIILESYQESPYSKFSDGAGDYIQVCYHLLFTGIINELIEFKVLPPVPHPTPEYFGVYITIGSYFD